MKPHRTTTRRIYVKVTSVFDSTGYMQPRSITWGDGRTFQIDAVRDFHPATSRECSNTDCYTVVIHGEERHLFFEKTSEHFNGRFGRWFVESAG